MSTKVNLVPDENGNDPFVQLSGSNVEGVLGQNVPAKGVLIAGKDASGKLQTPRTDFIADGLNNDLAIYAVSKGVLYSDSDSKWYQQRGNTQGTLLASAARTATTATPIQTNYNARGISVFLNITVASGTGGISITIEGQDPVSTSTFQLNVTPTAILATGKYVFELYPGISGTGATVSQRTSGILPRSWRAVANHSDGSSYTYSVGYALIL